MPGAALGASVCTARSREERPREGDFRRVASASGNSGGGQNAGLVPAVVCVRLHLFGGTSSSSVNKPNHVNLRLRRELFCFDSHYLTQMSSAHVSFSRRHDGCSPFPGASRGCSALRSDTESGAACAALVPKQYRGTQLWCETSTSPPLLHMNVLLGSNMGSCGGKEKPWGLVASNWHRINGGTKEGMALN